LTKKVSHGTVRSLCTTVLTRVHKQWMKFNPNCHPSWVGKMKPAFIARFKYGCKPWKSWVNFLVKNSHVELYLKLSEEFTPAEAMSMLGFKPRKRK